VVQRTENTESIELTNLGEGSETQAPVVAEAPDNAATAAAEQKTAAKDTPAGKAKIKIKKKILLEDGTEEEVLVDSDENTSTNAQANVSNTNTGGNTYLGGATTSNGTGASTGNGADTRGTYNGGSTSNGTGTTSGSASVSSSNSGTTAATGAGLVGASGSGSTAATGTGTGTNTPSPTSALETKLESYRNQILTEVTSAQVTNPALTRRYLQVNRTTYQATYGK
jgi:hypothetical protein